MLNSVKINSSLILVLISCLILGSGCAKKIERVEVEKVIDLSGKWNDTDSRLVSEEIITDCLNHPWINQFTMKHSQIPVIIIGSIRNMTQDHIAVNTFISDLERACINSGKVNVVASEAERQDLRLERESMTENAKPETKKQLRSELGADYMLSGSIEAIEDREGNKKVVYYQVNLTLSDLESNQKVWMGQKKIKKFVEN
jgi:uncharacterized protein (TIGR02722 family)